MCIGFFSLFILGTTGCSSNSISQEEFDNTVTELTGQVDELTAQLKESQDKNKELQVKIDQAKPWFDMSEAEQKAKAEELQKQKEAAVAAAENERLAKEEAARLAKEEEEKIGYNTGITYDQLARTPDDYNGKKIKFSGKVLQVMESDGQVSVRLAINSDYNSILYVVYKSDIVSSRVLEDDYITVMGLSKGLYKYEATSGATITIPCMLADIVEQ